MKALFLVQSPHEGNLPPMGVLQYLDTEGNTAGGWWCVSEAPLEHPVIVCVDSTNIQLDEIANNPEYLYLDDVVEPEVINA